MHTPKEVREMNTAELNFYMGANMGELTKLLKGSALEFKTGPILADLFVLCGEAGFRAKAWEKEREKPL
jgi:hypothetical protein